jgi:hypothetical protein
MTGSSTSHPKLGVPMAIAVSAVFAAAYWATAGTHQGEPSAPGPVGAGSSATQGTKAVPGPKGAGAYRIIDGRLHGQVVGSQGLALVDTPAKLDALSALSFTIFSDTKGRHVDSEGFNRMVAWSAAASNHIAYLGNGDLVCPHSGYGPHSADLVDLWMPANPAFTALLYPTVGDGENQYFSGAQRHWCGGRAMLQHAGMLTFDSPPKQGRPATVQDVRVIQEEDRNGDASPPAGELGCDYHAIIRSEPYKLHVISFTFGDEPVDQPKVQFTEPTRRWLMERLRSIDKTGSDIVVVMAHSQCRWDQELAPARRERLYGKADLILSASCHTYQGWPVPSTAGNTPLVLNTGQLAIGENGFTRVHLVPGDEATPPVLVTRYIVADSDTEPWENHSHTSGPGTRFTVIGGAAIQGGY